MNNTPQAPIPGSYPAARREDCYEELHGMRIHDPYRWLEDIDSEETRQWIKAQNSLTATYLSNISVRVTFQRRLTELWNFEKFGVPFRRGERYFYTRNDGLQNQSSLYWLENLEAQPRLLLDPNLLSEDGTISLTGISVSSDGRHLAYGLSASGSDWQEWRIRRVDDNQDLGEVIRWTKFTEPSWDHENEGFYYSRYDEPEGGLEYKGANYYQKLYYHALGTGQATDRLVYHRPDQKEWGFDGHVTEDGDYLVISIWKGTHIENNVFYKDLNFDDGEVIELLTDFAANFTFVGNDGSLFYFSTDMDAPLGKLIAIDLNRPDRSDWMEVVPESKFPLLSASLVNDQFILHYLHDARSEITIHDKRGEYIRHIELPGLGTVEGFRGKKGDRETFYLFTSFTTPATIYHVNLETGQSQLFLSPNVTFDPEHYHSEQVFVTGQDGTRFPLFLNYKKGTNLQNAPAYLYGYGGFNIPLTPVFSVSHLVWMEMGGIFAQANLRGGGEYGKAWHEAGMILQKQNVFDDFIAAAEFLIEQGYTSTQKLAIGGRSNGGLLVGACLTQRRDLFGACLVNVGVLDMLRFHKFTIGWAWVSDYGSPDDPSEFKALLAYSPYHNLRSDLHYPPTLICTGDHDDRVFPAHSYKFAAALQYILSQSDNQDGGPALIRIDTKAGHGLGKPTSLLIDEISDQWAFIWHVVSGSEV
jgi:prolyl oligopeptidase